MLFLTFTNQDERREYGGSAFMEIQPCLLSKGTGIEKIVAADSIVNWKDDSLYISDENEFCRHYSGIFKDGIYNNLQRGAVDPYGINYYPPQRLEAIIKDIEDERPEGWKVLSEWLRGAEKYNGIYILGI